MAPPLKRALPKALPAGFILTDSEKKKWRLGGIIGHGGCGTIYLASRDLDRDVPADTDFVLKVESRENGPLFSELKFYQRAAKPGNVQKWKQSRKLDFLGIPTYWGSGLAEHNELRYRFMVMERLGTDLQKVVESSGGRLEAASVLQLGQGLVDVLEYIHENEYVHADIKAANLMLCCRDTEKVYLADYGLSYRYCPDGEHKQYKENPKKGHNGTIEYTSLDAHRGAAPSRRGDLQILGFCLLHWLCGSLPWNKLVKKPTEVQEAKQRLMDNLPDSVQHLSVGGASTDQLASFLSYVKTLGYTDRPDYRHLKQLLASAGPGRLGLSVPRDPPAREKTSTDEEHKTRPVPARYMRGPPPTKPRSQQSDDAAGRSLRPRPVVAYGEDDSEEEEARPKPVPDCYLRGSSIGSRDQPKQRTDRTWKGRKHTRPTHHRGPPPHHQQHRRGAELREPWSTPSDQRGLRGWGYGTSLCWEHRRGSGERGGSALGGLEQEAGPWGRGLWTRLVYVSVLLFLGLVLAV
uniref:non-specific serine/threonine protein kinase n=1 Tax=Gasterosteus aculeatus aculeatus TaxID=481459 RepID=A0AAQ4PDS1_GASAC|nr:serine/threonine-protein kinase VRK2 isoform X1 [Gasterosteus aculeatus aculeatus]XP_040034784.1 serine/threonine-protein kinase VRK2 isoform X1 [Gasterosteus aculeatus aculeatus]